MSNKKNNFKIESISVIIIITVRNKSNTKNIVCKTIYKIIIECNKTIIIILVGKKNNKNMNIDNKK